MEALITRWIIRTLISGNSVQIWCCAGSTPPDRPFIWYGHREESVLKVRICSHCVMMPEIYSEFIRKMFSLSNLITGFLCNKTGCRKCLPVIGQALFIAGQGGAIY